MATETNFRKDTVVDGTFRQCEERLKQVIAYLQNKGVEDANPLELIVHSQNELLILREYRILKREQNRKRAACIVSTAMSKNDNA